jgi:alkylation response protein AidB-like acyl-CoA dehydrogenase
MVDFRLDDELAEHRVRARAWYTANVRSEWVIEQHTTGTHHTPELHRRMARDGILAADWPPEYGGSDVEPGFAYAVQQEILAGGLYLDGWATTQMVLRTVLAVGSEEQKRRWIPAGLRGEMVIVLGYTEPGSGSDAAAAATRAVRDGNWWVINGNKMFTSTAHAATHVFILTRSNTEVPKHRGLTMFIVPLDAEGVDIQPVHTLGGQRTNATFYADVRVPDADRVGDVDGGWRVMREALIHERAVRSAPVTTLFAEQAAAWAKQARRPDGAIVYDDPSVREQLAHLAVENEVARLLGMRVQAALESPGGPTYEGPVNKLYSAEMRQRNLATILDIAGEEAVLQIRPEDFHDHSPSAFVRHAEHDFRNAVVGTIYGGSTEVMREIVAERILGLPRNRPRS